MAFIIQMSREIQFKFVYWGPEGAGRMSSLRWIEARVNNECRTRSLPQVDEPPVIESFDFVPAGLERLRGLRVRFFVYAPVRGRATGEHCKNLLRGVDGVVFVADSRPERRQGNVEALAALKLGFSACGIDEGHVGLSFAYNQRDREEVMAFEQMQRDLNPSSYPAFATVAPQGTGVFDAFRGCVQKAFIQAQEQKF